MGATELLRRVAALPSLARIRRGLNSSPLIPGRVREWVGGVAWSSGDYRVAGTDEIARTSIGDRNGWHEPKVAARQRDFWAHAPDDRPDIANLRAAVAATDARTVLEVGCGPAYNRHLMTGPGHADRTYVGVDFSRAQLAVADAGVPLVAGDASSLPFRSRSVDVTVDGGALIHVPRWEAALREHCRVARDAVILHTLTVTGEAPTTYFTKRAYGYAVPELAFARADIIDVLHTEGFVVAQTWSGFAYDIADVTGITTCSETWLCRRVP